MLKQKLTKIKRFTTLKRTASLSALVLLMFVSTFASSFVNADRFDEQINNLRKDNAVKQAELDSLEVEAKSLQETINALQTKINALQEQINTNQAKRNELLKEIAKAQKELDYQKNLLGQNIRSMYLEGEISTLEMLASSKDLSEFLDKQEYRNAVQDKIKVTLDKINALKAKLNEEKNNVERLLKEQESLQAQIASQKATQDRLLGFNQSQQDSFNSQIASNQKKITELRRQQILENIRLFGGGTQPGIPGGGGYPWGNAYCVHTGKVGGDCYNYDWYFNGNPWDAWGYGYRNCTSWVAYKLAMDGKHGFTYLGNAAQWPGGASARGISVTYGSGARAGDAAVNPNGFYGHVMYVEAVLGDGRVVVSDYNRMGDGLYRGPDGGNAGVLSQSSLVFIHF